MQITSINGLDTKLHNDVAQIQQTFGGPDKKVAYEPIVSRADEYRPFAGQRKPSFTEVNQRYAYGHSKEARRGRRLSLPMLLPTPRPLCVDKKATSTATKEKAGKKAQEVQSRERIVGDKAPKKCADTVKAAVTIESTKSPKPTKAPKAAKEPKPPKVPKVPKAPRTPKAAKPPKTPKPSKTPRATKSDKSSKAERPAKATKAAASDRAARPNKSSELDTAVGLEQCIKPNESIEPPHSTTKTTKVKNDREWHAPDSYIYEDLCSDRRCDDIEVLTQKCWYNDIPMQTGLPREQRLQQKRDILRRQAYQLIQAQQFRNSALAKKRLIVVARAINKFDKERNRVMKNKCGVPTCSNAAVALTAYCYLHITLSKDQKLFQPCTAKFSDNSQCRVPVLDITHDLPLCREHAWKRDNYNRISQEQKPKKCTKSQPPQMQMSQQQMAQHTQLQPQPKQPQQKPPKAHSKTKSQPPIQQPQQPLHAQLEQEQAASWQFGAQRPVTNAMAEPLVNAKHAVAKAPRPTHHKHQQPTPYPQQHPPLQSIHPQLSAQPPAHPQMQAQPQPRSQPHHPHSHHQLELQSKQQPQAQPRTHTQAPAKAKSSKQTSRPAKRSRAKRAYNSLSSPSSSSLSSLSSSEMHVPATKRPYNAIDSVGSTATVERNSGDNVDTAPVQPNKMAKARPSASPAVHPNTLYDGLNSAAVGRSAVSQAKKLRSVAVGPMGPVAPAAAAAVDVINVCQFGQIVPAAPSLSSAGPPSKKPKPNKLSTGGLSGVSLINAAAAGIGIGGNIAIGPSSFIYGTANNGHIDMHDSDVIEMSLGDTRLLEEHDLNNVLNQLPEDAFNEFFEVQQSDHYEPTQMEQDELARALEEVDQQVKSLEQCVSIHGTGATHFLDSFLDVDGEILVETSDICEEMLSST